MQEVEMKKGKIFLSVIVFVLFLNSLSWGNGLNLNSLGSRALAMGGAFVGLADDFSAIFWNPAGIAQFKTEYFGFYGTDIMPSGNYKLTVPYPGLGNIAVVNAKTPTKHYLGGLAAFYYPVSGNLVVGIGVYTPSGLGSKWNGEDFKLISANKAYEWGSKVGVITISPAAAYKFNDKVSIGATFNLNYGMFNIKTHGGSTEIPVYPYTLDLGQYEENMNAWGIGATFGILVKPSEMFSLGATLRTASTIKFEGDAKMQYLSLLGLPGSSDLKRDVTWPMWLALGVAFKPIDKLTLTSDVQWTQWSKIDVMKTDFVDPYWKLMMAASGDDKRQMYWEDKAQIRFGAEYQISPVFALRAGYYWDPSPAPDRTMNVLLPNYDFNVLTFGIGYALDTLKLEFGVEYLMGRERTVDYLKVKTDPEWATAMPGTYNMTILVPNISVSYKF
jgi:long-chain fatty acid transport protein